MMAKTKGRLIAPALLVALGACAEVPEGVMPVTGFDAGRYQGTWYEIARLDHSFERGLSNVTAGYWLRPGGEVEVVNSGFDRAACQWRVADGIARFQGTPDVASLSVTFFWPFYGGYNVFALDRDGYAWAAVAGQSRDYLWILARRPRLDPGILQRLVDKARGLGFPVEKLVPVRHDKPECTPA